MNESINFNTDELEENISMMEKVSSILDDEVLEKGRKVMSKLNECGICVDLSQKLEAKGKSMSNEINTYKDKVDRLLNNYVDKEIEMNHEAEKLNSRSSNLKNSLMSGD